MIIVVQLCTMKYIASLKFGITGMTNNWFEKLWISIKWSYQPDERPGDMTGGTYW